MKILKVGDCFDFIRNGKSIQQNGTHGYPITRIETIANGVIGLQTVGYSDITSLDGYEEYLLKYNDILMSHINSEKHLGKVAIFNDSIDVIHGMNLLCMRVNESIVDGKYAYYYFKSNHFRMQLLNITKKSVNQASFNITSLKQLDFIHYPIETQKKIVEVLDKAQALIDARKEQIRLMDELIQAQFIEMFGDPVTNPKGWKIKKLVEIGSLERGKSKHRPRNAPELLCGKYPLVQTGDIANAGLYIHNYSQTYSELGLQQSKMWNKGTLCITIAANIAKTSILGFDSCFPDSIVAFIPNSNVESMYVQIWFRFLQKIIENNAPESAQKNINLKILRDLDIPLPDIYIQKKFCKVIDMIEVERKRLNTSLTELENIYNSIMKKSFGNIL